MVQLTQSTKPISEKIIMRNWHLIDVRKKFVGRIVPQIVHLLQGKHKTTYVSNLDGGDYVVVINAKEVAISGKKAKTKIYTSYSGYPGGLKSKTFNELIESNPAYIIERAVLGMLPKNKLRDRRMARLFIYAGSNHPYKEKFS